jgi:hypothetical protein
VQREKKTKWIKKEKVVQKEKKSEESEKNKKEKRERLHAYVLSRSYYVIIFFLKMREWFRRGSSSSPS